MDSQSQGSGFALAKEFSGLRLGDRRLEKRFIHVMDRLMSHPTQSIYEAMGSWCEAKAAYRLFDNEKLDERKVIRTHRQAVLERIQDLPEVLVIQDTTTLVYTTHSHAQGIGSVSQGARNTHSRGIFFHSAYALSADGVPLGFLGQQMWSRARLKEGDELWYTESYKWRALVAENSDLSPEFRSRFVYVCDREGDFWDLLSDIQTQGSSFVVRAMKQPGRKGALGLTNVERALAGVVPGGVITESISTRPSKNGIREPAVIEDVKLEVSFVQYDLKNTVYYEQKDRNRDLKVYLVRAKEIGTKPLQREPIDWILKTNRPVSTLSEAVRAIRIYQHRWQVETFHKILKSGCQVEKTRLEEVETIQKYVAAMSIIAWRLHALSWIARKSPDETHCEGVLSPLEWKALYCQIHRTKNPPQKPPTLKQAVRWIAQLGGFYGRKGDGEPGVQTLWRGWRKLNEITDLYELFSDSKRQTCG